MNNKPMAWKIFHLSDCFKQWDRSTYLNSNKIVDVRASLSDGSLRTKRREGTLPRQNYSQKGIAKHREYFYIYSEQFRERKEL